jgi:ankyrin repeat protein
MCRFGGLDDVEYKKVAAALCRITTAATRRQPTTPEAGQSLLSEEEKRVLLASLKFDQIDARQMTIKKAHAQTCKWLLETPKYLGWLDPSKLGEHHGFLWIKGKPGTGKSTLMKFALANARKTMRDTIVISFFFNARGDDLEKSTVGMYRSLLLQLLERVPVSQDVFNSLELRTWNGGYYKWGIEALKALFEEIILGLGELPVTCFIDALDECDEDQIRDMVSFFENVGGMTTEANPPIKFQVCFSSRHYPNIKIARGLKLVLEGQEEHSKDIARYLGSELKIGHSTLAEQIRTDLQEKALGVFMWVVLVVEILNKEHDAGRIHALRQRLREIPGDLHKLFRDILTRDQHNRGELLLCVQWVLFARKPLKPEQLYCAILSGVEPEALKEWDPEEITAAVMKRFILNSSKGLAEVTQSKSPTVQFIHESVKDFLLKENGLREIWSDLGGNFEGVSHERLKQCCLNYTRIDIAASLKIAGRLPTANTQQAAKLRESANQKFPLLEYATRNVLYHADAAEEGGISQLGFLHDFQLADWIKLDNLFERHEVRRHTAGASSLYILSESNLPALIKVHPLRQSCFQEEDERYGTPFLAALATDSDRAVEAFVEVWLEMVPQESPFRDLCKHFSENRKNGKNRNKIGRNFTFSRKRGALSYAAEQGDEALLTLFLGLGQASLMCEDGQSTLWRAARAGHETIVQLLLETGQVDVESKDTAYGRTPLSWAANRGHEAVVRLLLKTGQVNVESEDAFYSRTPLSWAAEGGHEAVVRLLLKTGQVNVESEDPIYGRTPLSWAANRGHEAVARLLLETGEVDVESKDTTYGRTPLSSAAENGHDAVVRLLLNTGHVDVDSKDDLGQTPLSRASEGGHEAVVRLLLEIGKADFRSKDNIGRTPLSWATEEGHKAVIQLLGSYVAQPL